MKGVSQFRRKKLKAKLICSFNGAFQIRPPSGNLRYTGGETRIITVDRNIGFPKLKSKIAELIRNPNYKSQQQYSFSLIYHFSDTSTEEDEEQNSMALIASDHDVSYMMDEYEKLEFFGKRYRLWIFVCNDNDNLGEIGVINNKGRSRSDTTPLGENQNCGDKLRGRVRSNEDCLRKMLLKQQMFAKQSARIWSCCDQCIIDLGSGPESSSPLSCSSTNPSFDKDLAKVVPFSNENVHVDLGDSRHGLLRRSFGNVDSQCSCGFNRSIGVMSSPETNWMSSCCDANCEPRNVEPASLSDVNRENIMPWDAESMTLRVGLTTLPCSNQLVGSVYSARSSCSGSQGGIRNHQFGSSNTRNQRIFPYDFRNNKNRLHEMRNLRNAKFDGRPWVGYFYPGVGSSSSISKQGQFMRSHYPISSKPLPDSHRLQLEGEVRRTSEYVLHNENCSCSLPYGSRGNYSAQSGVGDPDDGKPTLDECPSSFYDPIPGNQSLVPPTTSENSSRGIKETNTQVDLLTDPVTDQDEVTSQLDVNVPNSPSKQGLGLHSKIPESGAACQSLSTHQSGSHMLEESIASSVNFSLHSLSLSSLFNDVEPEKYSSISSLSEALLKPQSSNLELMDEDNFSSGPQVQSSRGATYTAPEKPLKMQKGDDREVELQLDNTSTLIVDEKEDIKKTYTRPKMIGGIPAQVASVYTQLATRELQTIKNSDLEYIKELGSGAYGTVFHGKWKGSDVAVKRLKPCCFNECAVEEDRLVSDFWKEANILGQLHHPNIVALYGVVTDGPVTNLATVTEYMVNGSLKQVLRRKDRTIDRRKRLILAMDAAFGVEYLHEKNIVHFDLKSHNFLVNMRDPQRPVCKIGDLGLSKIKEKRLVSGGVRGTIPWMAPELLSSQNMVTEKVDVYSFGIVMWELLTGEEPYANMRSHEIIGGIIEGSLRPEIPSWCDPAWRSLMERCWSSNPDARPSFTEIAKELRAMAAGMNIK